MQVVQYYPNMVHVDRELLPLTTLTKADEYVA